MKEKTKLFYLVALYLMAYFIPWAHPVVRQSGLEAFMMLQEYAREHVLTCLIPAFFIAGAIAVFVSQASVLKYFGNQAKKILSYSVASISGTILAVCSCTVLPLFAGIYTRGAGIGPATAFLYSGPAINVLAITMTAKILGWQLGLARAVGAVVFAVVTGLLMATIFKKDDMNRTTGKIYLPDEEDKGRTLFQDSIYILVMVLILVFAAFAKPAPGATGLWAGIFAVKWYITAFLLISLFWMLKAWFTKDECVSWIDATWGFMKQIFPLLFGGVIVAGFLLGRPGHPALIPEHYIQSLLGGNSLWANLFASVAGAFMYFATLTEVPILQGLLGAGMGKGPALALLLAGPALSLPNMLVIGGIMGVKKTAVFCTIIVVLSTIAGMIYGTVFG
ncbi:permease [Desulfobacter hydrogenophilus]|uniref:Permease n=1 Tax=Desulfobacter hydrogenophilus TaxID=2291 RepID=A0A328FEA4_9BACT|nr:permease [Desulfobacter hydrogenophilus]NDY71008.1 permease [Desulfobacter hydrogenophilus]QBH12754.1 permease [Desulfobacter hydrogenophilus]RAM02991.1 permease [Desulfobacter hydrogenophilus]